jgi:hypothetical protein
LVYKNDIIYILHVYVTIDRDTFKIFIYSTNYMLANTLKKAWNSSHIRKKIFITLGLIAVYKVLSTIPVPGIQVGLLAAFTE